MRFEKETYERPHFDPIIDCTKSSPSVTYADAMLNSVWQKNTILLIGGLELARIAILEQAIF